MKQVLKRLQDGIDDGSISIDEARSQLGPTSVYFDTCDLKLYTKLKKSIDKNVGYNHLFLFDQDVKEKIPVDVYKDYIKKACDHIESLLHDNPKMSQRIDLVKKNWLSLTIITSSIDEEFELFKSIRASYSDIEFNATFGQRYEEDFKNYIYKELRKEANLKKDSSDLGSATNFLYKTNLVKFFGGEVAAELLSSLTGKSRERYVLQGKITSDFLKNPHSVSNFFSLDQVEKIESDLEEYSVWNNQIVDLLNILKKKLK